MQRRDAIKTAGAFAGISILPSGLWGNPANNKLQSAHVGVGGKGRGDLKNTASHDEIEVAAICDVDKNALANAAKLFPNARQFRDYREMFEVMGDKIDVVTVSTPDHTHAPASLRAMDLGKGLYCQKPLTHNVAEARALAAKAKETGVTTQMGIQNQSTREYQMALELLRSGAIGRIKRVHSWSFKQWGFDGTELPAGGAPPAQLDWDLWLGTAAERPYIEGFYHPKNWRKILDFGTGTMGDMGIHILDPPMLSLGLGLPLNVQAECRQYTGIGHPTQTQVHFEFAGTKYTDGKLKLIWTDGRVPDATGDLEMPGDWQLPKQGSMFIGEEGRMMLPHIGGPRLFPEEKFAKVKYPRMERIDHYGHWLQEHQGKAEIPCRANFAYGAKLTETVLLGVIACRFPGMTLQWDAKGMRFPNLPAADKLLNTTYRPEFAVAGG